jgi:beta-glucosidase-like glycosyl hydrolase/4-amino-4-deoxy-L-arabinose transferase-like glycosyltransferase
MRRPKFKTIIKLIFTLALFVYLFSGLIGLKHDYFHEDEYVFVKRGSFLNLYLKGDFSNPAWKEFASYDVPKLAEYIYGATLVSSGHPDVDKYLQEVDFIEAKEESEGKTWWQKYAFKDLEEVPLEIREKAAPILTARNASVILGMGVFILIILIGVSLGRWLEGLVASFLLYNNFLSQQVLVKAMGDTPLFFFLLLHLYLSILLVKKINKKKTVSLPLIIVNGIISGLAVSVKLNGGISLIYFFLLLGFVYLFSRRIDKKEKKKLLLGIFLNGLVSFMVFYFLNPFIWGKPIKNSLFMLEHRRGVFKGQQQSSPGLALKNIGQRLTAVYNNFFGQKAYYRNFSIKAFKKKIPVDFLLLISGLLIFIRKTIKIFKRKTENANFLDFTVFLWLVCTGASVILLVPIDWDRYYSPLVVVLTLIEAKVIAAILNYLYQMVPQNKIKKFLISLKENKYFYPGVVFSLTLIAFLWNSFNYPVFLGDEGIYSFQAWWLAKFGKLSPYTYWYDHSPFGWLLIGLWQRMTFGPTTFGFTLNSGRVFMAFIGAVTNLFVYLTVKKLTKNKIIGLFSALLFALSPLNIIYHRQILLDNIETLFLVLSLYFLFNAEKKVSRFLLSGLFFGFSFLSKEIVAFLLPAYLLTLLWESKGENNAYLRLIWIISAGFLISLFPLLALLKGEFFPGEGHVSFLETVVFQMSRGSEYRFWQPQSMFYQAWKDWIKIDPIIIFLGLWSVVVNLFNLKNKKGVLTTLLALSYIFFLIRGGLVLGFYLIPLLALFVINTGIALQNMIKEYKFVKKGFLIFFAIFIWLFYQSLPVFTRNITANQKQVVNYIKQNLAKKDYIVVDDFAYLDLKIAGFNVDWYSKVENDPEVREDKLKDNWKNIDYIMTDDYIEGELRKGNLPFLNTALENASLVKEFLNQEQKEKGIEVRLYKVNKNKLTKNNTKVEDAIESMSLEQKVGKLFVIGIDKQGWNQDLKEMINQYHFNAFFVKDKNFENQEELRELVTNINQQSCSKQGGEKPPNDTKKGHQSVSTCIFEPLIFVDQEGGGVNTVDLQLDNQSTPQAQIKNKNQALQIGQKRGQKLAELGINANFAPVVEISRTNFSYLNQQSRIFRPEENQPEQVYQISQAMVDGFQQEQVMPVAKHFPGGLGRVMEDPHQTLPLVDINRKELNKDLYVFEKMINNQEINAIMTTHLKYPQVDAENPVTTSDEFISGILRKDLGFSGLIISDDLVMNAISTNFTISEAATKAILAGHDLVLISGYHQDQTDAYEVILKSVQNGQIDENRVDQTLKRLYKLSN